MSGLSTRIASLSPEKQRLLEVLRAEKRARRRDSGERATERPPTAPFSLVREEDRARLPDALEDAYPLASMQVGMLYHLWQTLDDPVPAYHNVFMYTLDMPLVVPVVARAVEQLAAQQPILRTSFDVASFSQPLQLVHSEVQVQVPEVDLTGLAPADRERETKRFQELENRRVIDVSRPPLLRFTAHRLERERFHLTMTELHAVAEGWGTRQTLIEIYQIYDALRAGEPVTVKPPSFAGNREFVRLEQEALASPEQREFWLRRLDGATTSRLPRWPRWGRPEVRSLERTRSFHLTSSLQHALERFVRRSALPYKTVFLTAYLKALSLLAGRRLLTGLSVHNRPEEEEAERVLGVYVNTLPLIFDVTPGSWEQLARRVFEAEVELMPYQRYPMAALQREQGRQELIETAFGYAHFHLFGGADGPGGVEGVRVREEVDHSVSHFPLVVFFREVPPHVNLWMENLDTEFTEQQVLSLARCLFEILDAMTGDPSAAHHARCLLPAAERHQQVLEWNDTAAPEVCAGSVLDLWRERVADTPTATAVVHGAEELTYSQLDALSNRVAAALVEVAGHGFGAESRVGLHLGRQPLLLAALLGIWKSGAAAVPLDPEHPSERRLQIAHDAGLDVLLYAGGLEEELDRSEIRRIDLAEGLPANEGVVGTTEIDPVPEQLAYALYTSGSTGRPKGVMVPHRGLVNYLRWAMKTYPAGKGVGSPVHSSTAVDMTLTSLLVPLLSGAPAILLSQAGPGEVLDETLALGGDLGIVKLTPSHLEVLAQRLPVERAEIWTRMLVVGGEALRADRLGFWRRHAPRTRVINEYGPTEAVVGCAVHEVTGDGSGAVPIGRPIDNARLHVLDEHLHPVPLGRVAELWIGGDCVSRGYLGRPAATADRFRPDPSPAAPGDRLYRSGDLARRHPDGVLEYAGRNDQQVKVRGFRVELGEVEAALGRHPAIAEVVVAAPLDETGARRLVAYFVCHPADGDDRPPQVEELRSFLEDRLPEPMVPSLFVPLAEMPLTASGKVDRRALPEPEIKRRVLGGEAVAPRNRIERSLAEIWCQELGLDQVGVHDNFFDLGGDSLRLLRTQVKVQALTERELSIAEFFRYPTIANLADHLSDEAQAAPPKVTGAQRGAERQASRGRRAAVRERRRTARRRGGRDD